MPTLGITLKIAAAFAAWTGGNGISSGLGVEWLLLYRLGFEATSKGRHFRRSSQKNL